jgi:hypothetical protein
MRLSRYANDLTVRDGTMLQTNQSIGRIRRGVENGTVPYRIQTLRDGERLDMLAHQAYGDGSMWWVIAAASGIGWWLQVPPGTVIRIPTDIGSLAAQFG